MGSSTCNDQYIDYYLFQKQEIDSTYPYAHSHYGYAYATKHIYYLHYWDSSNKIHYVIGLDITDPSKVLFAKEITFSSHTTSDGYDDTPDEFSITAEDSVLLAWNSDGTVDSDYSRFVLLVPNSDLTNLQVQYDIEFNTANGNFYPVGVESSYMRNAFIHNQYGDYVFGNYNAGSWESGLYKIANNAFTKIANVTNETRALFSDHYILIYPLTLIDLEDDSVVSHSTGFDPTRGVSYGKNFVVYDNKIFLPSSADSDESEFITLDLSNAGHWIGYKITTIGGDNVQRTDSNRYVSTLDTDGNAVLGAEYVQINDTDTNETKNYLVYFSYDGQNTLIEVTNINIAQAIYADISKNDIISIPSSDEEGSSSSQDFKLYKAHYIDGLDLCYCASDVGSSSVEHNDNASDSLSSADANIDATFLDLASITDFNYGMTEADNYTWCGAHLTFVPFTHQLRRIRKSGVVSYG